MLPHDEHNTSANDDLTPQENNEGSKKPDIARSFDRAANEATKRSGGGEHTLSKETRKRRSRAKKRSAWEEEQIRNNGPYAQYLREIASRYPTLTPQEVRVCACIKLMMSSWQIAERFAVTEKAVNKYRSRAKKKMQLGQRDRLSPHVLKI